MKATLEFNLPEDAQMFDYCNHGPDLFFAVGDMLTALRMIIKHNENETQVAWAEETRDWMIRSLSDRNLDVYL